MNVITLAQAALFAALAYIGFSYFRIDIPVGPGSTAFHFGNTFVVVAALLLGGSWGGLAGAVGLSLADLMSGKYFTVAPQTFFLKLCIGLITGFVAHQIFHISTLNKKSKILTASIVASVAGLGFNVIADPVVGYFYKKIILGVQGDLAINWAKITAVTTFVNAVTSAIMAVLLYNALRPALISAHMFLRKEPKEVGKK
ncbi:MAG TPA: riboflavin transporter [Lachnoclostridium phytofermentans]|uniref:Riboflavin transporter n=2 Tax=Lachnoclostridium TaxID=1506553 RepID=A0A3D2X677_9FIRM|nr:riboflavin transporter [Lachnoclostridium phytofermentans]